MAKRYFSPHRKNEPSLNRIIIVLLVLFGVAYAVSKGTHYFRSSDGGGDASVVDGDSVAEARSLFDKGDMEAANSLLKPLIKGKGNTAATPQALMLAADIAIAASREEEALELLHTVTTKYIESPEYSTAAAKYGRLLEQVGRAGEAYAIYEDLRDNAPPPLRAAGLLGLARRAHDQQDYGTARDLYRQAMQDGVRDSNVWLEAVEGLGQINVHEVFSTEETPDAKFYVVEPGDSLTGIGNKLNTTQGLLCRANGIEDPSLLRPGQRLKFTPKDFRIVIERSTCRLFLLDKEGVFKSYRTGLGMPGYETALGRYTVGSKQKDPTWFKPGSEPIPAGDPENELGTRWLPLVPAEEGLPTDLGIHGTIAPETIGEYKSHGCPRLTNENVEELYDLVVRSTPVEIVETIPPGLIG